MEKIRLRVFTAIQLLFALVFLTLIWLTNSCSNVRQEKSTFTSWARTNSAGTYNLNSKIYTRL